MGPFELLDFVGLDTTYYIAEIMFDEFKDPMMAAPPLLKRMVLAGRIRAQERKGILRLCLRRTKISSSHAEPPAGIITFNRPNVLNALRISLLAEVSHALSELESDPDVRAVIITGAGEKAFAAGADIAELNALPSAGHGADQARLGQALTRKIERLRKPVIMAINGFALGGGCEIAMAGDILIASEQREVRTARSQPRVDSRLRRIAAHDALGRQRHGDVSCA